MNRLQIVKLSVLIVWHLGASAGHTALAAEFQSGSVPAGAAIKKKLIEFGWDEPSTAFMRQHIAEMEKMPFDGCVFHVEGRRAPLKASVSGGQAINFTWECWGTNKFTVAEMQTALDDLKATPFKQFSHNFLRFNTSPARLDWFDDYSAVLANAEVAARIAREGKCAGILFDTEHYEGPLFNYRKQRDAGSKSFDQYATRVRQRGRETMAAFQKGFPSLTIMLTFAYSLPWAQTGGAKDKLPDAEYGLLASFMDGMFEEATGKTTIVDGYESSYAYKRPADFDAAYKTMKKTLMPIVRNAGQYQKHGSIGFGLWMDEDWRKYGWSTNDSTKNYFTPQGFAASLRKALERSDEYVWIYTETPRWWSEPNGEPQKLPPDYLQAVRGARETSGK